MLPSSGTRFAPGGCMAEKSLAERVAALEAKVGDKSIQEQFREQAEMLDERFFAVHQRLDGIEADVRIVKADVRRLKADVSGLKTDVTALKKDMTIVREGVGIILKKLR